MDSWTFCLVFITLSTYNRTSAASPANLVPSLAARFLSADAFTPTPGLTHAKAITIHASSPIASADTLSRGILPFSTSKPVCSDPDAMRDCSTDCTKIVECGPPMADYYDCQVDGLNCYNAPNMFPKCSRLSQCGGPIICAEAGEFPDPDSCTIYHSCAGYDVMSTVAECTGGTVYDMTTKSCETPTTACGTDGPVPTCTSDTQKGALADNPSYYYQCAKENTILYPALYYCGDASVYNGVGCVVMTTTTTDPTPTTFQPQT